MLRAQITLREFLPQDAEPLAALFFKTERRINLGDYTQAQVEAWAPDDRDMDKWRKSFHQKHVFVATIEQKIVGFGELELTGHIDRFYVDADHIGQGIGKAIYESIETRAIPQHPRSLRRSQHHREALF